MEMYALIKRNDDVELINGTEIIKKVNYDVKKIINYFLDDLSFKYGDDYMIDENDLDILLNYNSLFTDYVSDKVLKKIFLNRKKDEVLRLLDDVFSVYDLNDELISYIKNDVELKKTFNESNNHSISFDRGYVKKLFNDIFGYFIGNDLVNRMDYLISNGDYNFNYNVLELKKVISSSDDLVKLNRRNFELFLYKFGLISNPEIRAIFRHRCYKCANLSPLTCEKAEYLKKDIDDYSFINCGYQIYIVSGGQRDLVSFIVEDCDDYVAAIDDEETIKEDYSYVKKMMKKK